MAPYACLFSQPSCACYLALCNENRRSRKLCSATVVMWPARVICANFTTKSVQRLGTNLRIERHVVCSPIAMQRISVFIKKCTPIISIAFGIYWNLWGVSGARKLKRAVVNHFDLYRTIVPSALRSPSSLRSKERRLEVRDCLYSGRKSEELRNTHARDLAKRRQRQFPLRLEVWKMAAM